MEGSGTYGDIPLQQALAQGRLYVDKALQLDPGLAEAWAGLGLYYISQPTGGLPAGIDALEKALALNPGLIDASNWLHNALQATGRPAESRRIVAGMIERDPLYRPGIRNAVNDFIWFGEQEHALELLERVRPLIPNDAVIQSSLAAIHNSRGEIADAVKLAESAVALQPSNSVARLTLSFALMNSHQWERVAREGEEWHPIWALNHLGRIEEASMLAFRRAEERADIGTLFAFLNANGRSDELIAYLEERWPDLAALRADFPSYGGLGDFLMLDVSLAYRRAGNAERFEQALAMASQVHDRLEAEGVDNEVFFMNQAVRWSLAGDLEASLGYLARAIDRGLISSTRIVREWPALEPLEGDPRYEVIQARMLEHLNREREKLGLEPVSA
jgi:tetratricopeptide (TPR) repeat protein